jgi:uncharacterized protein YkwD
VAHSIRWLPGLAVGLALATASGVAAQARLEAEIAGRVNAVRNEHGRAPLRWNPDLAALAREHSRDMGREGFFSHEDPAGGSAADRVRAAGLGYRVLGENLARSRNAPDPAEAAVQGWMASEGHRENILDEAFTETGVGVWRDGETVYVTQLFRRP